ncbi:MAG: alpha/beta fold hydrolase [Gammaproteobacteria bacterium]
MSADVAITAGDGQMLQATVYESPDARTWVLVNSAMGVRRRFYRHLAMHLAGQGLGVVTYDYRGMGDSVVREGQVATVRLEDWGRQDFPAVLRWLRGRYVPARVVVLGHSVGGQVLGLAPDVRDVDGLVGVAAQSGYWRHWDGLERAKVFSLWYAAIPLLTPLADRFPAARFGLGQDIPSGVARQWAEWGRDPDYLRSPTAGPQPQYYEQVHCGLRTYLIDGDPLAPPRAVRAWHDWFPNADREFVQLEPRNADGRSIGHFGFFDPAIGAGEWTALTDFVRG